MADNLPVLDGSGNPKSMATKEVAAGVHAPKHVSIHVDTDGGAVMIDSLPQTLAYDGDGNLETITATDGVDSWVQTLTYTTGVLTGISGWVKQ